MLFWSFMIGFGVLWLVAIVVEVFCLWRRKRALARQPPEGMPSPAPAATVTESRAEKVE